MLLVHIIIALLGVGLSTWMFFAPSKSKLKYSYVLLLSTLLSGVVLVVFNNAHVLSACLSGLAYTAFVVTSIYYANQKLDPSSVKITK